MVSEDVVAEDVVAEDLVAEVVVAENFVAAYLIAGDFCWFEALFSFELDFKSSWSVSFTEK